MRSTHRITLTLAAAALGLTAAGCGSQAPTRSGTANAQTPAGGAYAYARCMRGHGVSGFPDPHVVTHPGSTSISQVAPAGLAASPAFKTAERACAHLQPGPGSARPDRHGPSKPVLLAFARCLRAHGTSNFPDPGAQGQLTQEMIAGAGINIHSPAFFAAARACVGVTHGAITVAQVAALVNHSH